MDSEKITLDKTTEIKAESEGEQYALFTPKETGYYSFDLEGNSIINFGVYDYLANSEELEKERKALKAIIDIKNKFGKSTILRGMSLDEKATMRKRNKLIGGHNGE